MTRQITWRCEACGGTLTARGLYAIAEMERIHAPACPDKLERQLERLMVDVDPDDGVL